MQNSHTAQIANKTQHTYLSTLFFLDFIVFAYHYHHLYVVCVGGINKGVRRQVVSRYGSRLLFVFGVAGW